MEWCDRWKIKINSTKCHAIYFSNKFILPPRLYINDTVINWDTTCKYLGVEIDRRLTWKPHVNKIKKKMEAAAAAISPLLYSNKLSMKNKTNLFKAIVLPTATYAAPVWAFAAKSHINTIESKQASILRRIRRGGRYLTNSTIRSDLKISTYRKTVSKHAKKFYHNINNIPNEIIAGLPDYDFRLTYNKKRPKATVLLEDM